MNNSVIIKGNRYGFSIVLSPEPEFDDLLTLVARKFQASGNFFDIKKPVALAFTGRDLSEEEQVRLVEVIEENSRLRVSCIVDGAKAVEDRFLEALSRTAGRQEKASLREMEEKTDGDDMNRAAKKGQFFRGILRSGQRIEADGSFVILGDVNPGAQIIAGGNVVILGSLKGTVYAGYPDDRTAIVAALNMEPMQIQIGDCIARSADPEKRNGRRAPKRKKQLEYEARMAFVDGVNICIEKIDRSLINEISNR